MLVDDCCRRCGELVQVFVSDAGRVRFEVEGLCEVCQSDLDELGVMAAAAWPDDYEKERT